MVRCLGWFLYRFSPIYAHTLLLFVHDLTCFWVFMFIFGGFCIVTDDERVFELLGLLLNSGLYYNGWMDV